MAGIYIHIPFCNSKCAYCGFYSVPLQKQKSAFLTALHSEMKTRAGYLKGDKIGTIYFGGGTPSLLSTEELHGIIETIHKYHDVDSNAEITLEANPDTLSFEYLKSIRNLGVNRLSIGIQSFFDDDLRYLSRRHDSSHAKACIRWAKEAGFDNLSLDLIYGLPTSSPEKWNANLDLFFETQAQHLSAYALTIEPNTILEKQIAMGKLKATDEEDAVRDYEILTRRTVQEGFLHYEISNFARPGYRSKHNCSYWNYTPYAGFGPSAHSFDGESRQWNISNVTRYIEKMQQVDEKGTDFYEKETLSLSERYNEYIMTSLRTMWGCDLRYMEREMGKQFSDFCLQKAQRFIHQDLITKTNEFLHLNDSQMLFADGIAAELFWE